MSGPLFNRLAAAVLLVAFTPAVGLPSVKWDGSEPPKGVYFYWYESSFYTGFAPPHSGVRTGPHPPLTR